MRQIITTCLDVVGILLVAGGVAAFAWPAGLIVLGVGVLVVSWRHS